MTSIYDIGQGMGKNFTFEKKKKNLFLRKICEHDVIIFQNQLLGFQKKFLNFFNNLYLFLINLYF